MADDVVELNDRNDDVFKVAVDNIATRQYQIVKQAIGGEDSATAVSGGAGVTDAGTTRVVNSSDDPGVTSLAAILAKLTADPATQTTSAAILAKLTADPATQTTLAAVLAKLTADPSTETTQVLVKGGIGQPADVAATSDTGTFSLIALEKRALEKATATLTALQSTDPVPITVLPAEAAATATIANAASLSGAVQVDGKFVGLAIPAAWTAAGLEFQISVDNVTYHDVYYAGAKYAVASAGVVASGYVAVDPLVFLGANWVKVRSATAGAAVNQGAERILSVRISG